jgi:molybdate transport system substrate-binding protein
MVQYFWNVKEGLEAMRFVSVLIILMLSVLSGCDNNSTTKVNEKKITVAAASDLYQALTEMGEQFTQETDIEVVFTFGSTGMLAKQIEEGAPFDLFAAAHESYIDDLIDKKSILADSKRHYAVGQLAFMTTGDGNVGIDEHDLQSDDVKSIAIANPEHAPYGKAAKEALESWGLWDELSPKIVYAENIRQAYQFVDSGNADVGLVAVSLLVGSDNNYTVIDHDDYQLISQALGIPSQTANKENSQKFADFITGEKGQDILEKYGFGHPEGEY